MDPHSYNGYMSRWSRIRGPDLDIELTASFVLIPGFSITRTFGLGNLFASYSSVMVNNTAGTATIFLAVFLDGVEILSSRQEHTLPTGSFVGSLSWCDILGFNQGRHTLDLRGSGAAAAGDEMIRDRTTLLVVELPPWDQDDGLIAL